MKNILLLILFFLSTFFVSAQTLTSITPNNAPKGQTLSVTITGVNTNFQQSNTTIQFFKNSSPTTAITVNSFTVSDTLTITASISISSSAATGLYDAYVYDSLDGSMYLFNSFNVSNAGAKSITITPAIGYKGQTLNVTITGNNTSFLQGSNTLSFFGQGTTSAFITNSLARNSATQMVASITVPPTATIGVYSVRLNTISDGQLFIVNGFTILPPSIKTVAPISALRGNTLNVTITGTNTHFTQGSTVVSFYDNNFPQSYLSINSVNATSDTVAIANVSIPMSSPITTYTLALNDSIDGTLFSYDVLSILPGTLSSIAPASGSRSQTLNVTITGTGASFVQGSTTVGFFRSGTSTAININSVTVSSYNSLTANITIQSNAPVGVYDVKIYTPSDGYLLLNSSFTVVGPIINSATPTVLNRGTKLTLTISGTNTHFSQGSGTNVSFFRQGSSTNFIVVDSVKAANSTSLTAYLTVSKFAPPGGYQLHTLNASDGELTYINDLTVALPVISSIAPSASPRNTTLDVTITGTGTNFTQATSTDFSFGIPISSANNILINSATAQNDSVIKLNITIIASAPIGIYILSYSNSNDGNLKANFVVNPAIPMILSLTPSTAKRGATLDVLITGQNTLFYQSSANVSVGFMKQGTATSLIKINSTAALSNSVIKLNITLDSTFAVYGSYDVNVFDSLDGAITKVNAFTLSNTGVNEIVADASSLKVYPNPASSNVSIELNKKDIEVKELIITDITGRIVNKIISPLVNNDATISINVRDLNLVGGTYFINISTASGSYYSKLLVE